MAITDAREVMSWDEKSRSTVASEYVWRRTDRWIMFPWGALPSVGGADAE